MEIIQNLVDIVSKNGSLLLNVGPKADGTIPGEDRDILLAIGEWLKINGEAIYGTSYWKTFGEGPTEIKEGQFTDGSATAFTSEDIRFTVKGRYLYATVLAYPEGGIVRIRSLSERSPYYHGVIRDLRMLGFEENPAWDRNDEALSIRTTTVKSSVPVVFRIEME